MNRESGILVIVHSISSENLIARHNQLLSFRSNGQPVETSHLVPIITVVGLQFGALLAGAIVTETIFSWPELGRLTVSAISNRDYALVQGCLLSIGLTYVLANLLTDVVYRWVNPRMRG